MVEAKKKTYVQVDVADDKEIATADLIAASPDTRPDLILQDLDFVETRLGRSPAEPERAALLKLKAELEADGFVSKAVLTPEEAQALAVHTCFLTSKPIVVATEDELAKPELLILRAYAASGHISFLTVGGKENRAGGDNGSAQGLIQRLVHDVRKRPSNPQLQVFPNTVKDHDGVVNGETDDGQDGCHNRPAQLAAREEEPAHGH